MEFVLSHLKVIEFQVEMIHVFRVVFTGYNFKSVRVENNGPQPQVYCSQCVCDVVSREAQLLPHELLCWGKQVFGSMDPQVMSQYLKWKFLNLGFRFWNWEVIFFPRSPIICEYFWFLFQQMEGTQLKTSAFLPMVCMMPFTPLFCFLLF